MAVAVDVGDVLRHEEVTVPHGLGDHEGRIQDQRRHPGERQLRSGVLQSGRAHGESGQHHRDAGQGHHGGQRRAGARGVERRHPAASGGGQQAHPDDAVERDHHRREHGVARVGRRTRAAAGHQHHDQSDFDDRHRDGQHQRAGRLADPVRHHLRVMHGGEHRADQECGDDRQGHRALVMGPGCAEHDKGEHGHDDGPLQWSPPGGDVHPVTLSRSRVNPLR